MSDKIQDGPQGVIEALPSCLSESDRNIIELAKAKKQVALAEFKAALAQNENADLAYKYTVLQIYMKYGLNQSDAINEDGTILKNHIKSTGQQ